MLRQILLARLVQNGKRSSMCNATLLRPSWARQLHSSPHLAKLASSRSDLKDCQRIIVKLGSAVVTKPDTKSLALGRLAAIVEQMAELWKDGKQCALVTSGAVALGRHHLGDQTKRSSRGANAALGMAEMVSLYGQLFEQCDLRTAAMLLTPIDFEDDRRIAYWRKALIDLMDQGVVPIINTNDAVAWDGETRLMQNNSSELEAPPIKDNDSLAARIAFELRSDLLMLVSDVDGLYTAPPSDPTARFISTYNVAPDEGPEGNEQIAFGEASNVGTGGMQSKLTAAAWTVKNGTSVVICRGSRTDCIADAIQGKQVGTFFSMQENTLTHTDALETTDSVTNVALAARAASVQLNTAPVEKRAIAIEKLASLLIERASDFLVLNTLDIRDAQKKNLQESLVARLELSSVKINSLADGLRQIAQQMRQEDGHVNHLIQRTKLADGLILDKVTAPIGVLMVIFESRPDCLPQIAALSIATANGLLVKPGSEATKSVGFLHKLVKEALVYADLPAEAVGLLETRKEVRTVLEAGSLVDLVIPRGSSSMIESVRRMTNEAGSGVPVMGHGSGICHVFVDSDADMDKALDIVRDAKCDYPAACNAMETLIVHSDHVANGGLEKICKHLQANNVKLYAGPKLFTAVPKGLGKLEQAPSLNHEYSDLQCTVELVDSMEEAIEHIGRYGSAHTDTIVTEDKAKAEAFLTKVDSACVFHNASTRFADGYRFGLGAEVGINTGRIHARGPVGVEGLLTTKWVLRGNGDCASHYGVNKKAFLHEQLPVNK